MPKLLSPLNLGNSIDIEGAVQVAVTTTVETTVAIDAPATAALTTITHSAPGTPDYAIQDLVQTTGFGFATADEGQSVLAVIANLQARVNELEAAATAATAVSTAESTAVVS